MDALQKAEDVVCELVDLDFPGTPGRGCAPRQAGPRPWRLAHDPGLQPQPPRPDRGRPRAQPQRSRQRGEADRGAPARAWRSPSSRKARNLTRASATSKSRHHGRRGEWTKPRDETVTATVTTVLQTTAGRTIFATLNRRRGRQAPGLCGRLRQGRSALSSALIVPAFGRGVRTGEDKLWAPVSGRPVIRHHARVHRRGGLLRPHRDCRSDCDAGRRSGRSRPSTSWPSCCSSRVASAARTALPRRWLAATITTGSPCMMPLARSPSARSSGRCSTLRGLRSGDRRGTWWTP